MKRKTSRALLCLLLSGMLTTEGMVVSAAENPSPVNRQESPADSDQEDLKSEINSDETPTENKSSETDTEPESSEINTESESSESEPSFSSEPETEIESSEPETETMLDEKQTETLLDEETTEIDDDYEDFTFTVINPLYDGMITADELATQLEQQQTRLFRAARESSSFNSVDEAASYLRQQMVHRNTTVSIQIPMSIVGNVNDVKNFSNQLLENATAHTEECNGSEGDALAFTYGGAQISNSFSSETCNITYTISYYTTSAQEQELTATVNEAISSLNLSGKTDYEKVKAIHDYICKHVDYDNENLNNSANTTKFSAYGALCTGKAVCQGYANAFYRMCKEAGLSVRIISGTGNGGPHAWNIVRIGSTSKAAGEYYNIDCTWDGQDATTHHTYFLLNEADFVNHVRDQKYTGDFYNQYPMSATSYVDTSSLETGLNQTNPDVTFTTLDDTTVSSAANGKPKLIIFFRTTCGNSQSTIKAIAGHSFPGVDLYAAEIDGNGKDAVASFKNSYGSDKIVFSYGIKNSNNNSTDNSISLFQYAEAGGLTNGNQMDVTLPVLCYIDSNNRLQHVTQGVQNASEIETNLAYYCGDSSVTNQYTITYELNGGTNDRSNPSSYTENSATIVLANPTKAGYTFDGWYRDAAFSQKITQIAQGTTGNLVLYAKWIVNPASDQWNLDNPEYRLTTIDDDSVLTTANGKPKVLIFIQETCARSEATVKSIASYDFDNVDVYVISTQYDINAFTSFINRTAPNSNQLLFAYLGTQAWNGYCDLAMEHANWKGTENTPTICYIDENNKLQYMTSGQQTAATIQTNIDKYCKNDKVDESTTYTITYILDGGKNDIANPSNYTSQSETIILKDPIKEGYTFAGWYTDAEFTHPITQITATNTGNLVLYAKWESKEQKPDVPSVDPKPGDDDNKPGDDDNKPGDDDNKPSDDDNKPGDDDNKPGDDNNKPGDDDNKPGDDDNKPGDDDNKPGDNNNDSSNNDNNSENNNANDNTNNSNNNTAAAPVSNNSTSNTAATLNWNQVQKNISNAISQNTTDSALGFVSMDFVSNGQINVPVTILNEIKGKNAIISFHNGQDVAMSINGMDLTNLNLEEVGNVNLTVVCDTNYIPATVVAAKASEMFAMRQISVLNAAQLKIPVQMNVKVDAAYAGQYANLYRYNPQTGTLEYTQSCQVIAGGYTVFPVTTGGNYLMTISGQMPDTAVTTQVPDVAVTTQMPDTAIIRIPDAESSQYTIKSGDTMSAIAKAHNISLAELLEMNPQIENVNRIKVNQVINVK